jgi:hypothetical protein
MASQAGWLTFRSQCQPVVEMLSYGLPSNCRDVTAEHLGTVIGIVGATGAKERWRQLPPWPPVGGSRVDPVAEREPGSTRLRVGSSKTSNHAQGTVSAKIIPARRAGQVFGTLSQRIFALGHGGECCELNGRISDDHRNPLLKTREASERAGAASAAAARAEPAGTEPSETNGDNFPTGGGDNRLEKILALSQIRTCVRALSRATPPHS